MYNSSDQCRVEKYRAATQLEPCPVLADRDSLHQVFLNLVNNSCDAMPLVSLKSQLLPGSPQQIEIVFSDSEQEWRPNVVEHV